MKRLYVIEAIHRPPRSDGMRVVKIGVTADVQRRMQDLQVGCPFPLRLLISVDVGRDAHQRERAWHAQFAAHLIRGREWFAMDGPTLRSLLHAVTAGQRPDPDDICDTCTRQIPLARRRHYPDTIFCSKSCRALLTQCQRMGVKFHHGRTPAMISILRKYGPLIGTESLESPQSLS